jgi:hypothetical protein
MEEKTVLQTIEAKRKLEEMISSLIMDYERDFHVRVTKMERLVVPDFGKEGEFKTLGFAINASI